MQDSGLNLRAGRPGPASVASLFQFNEGKFSILGGQEMEALGSDLERGKMKTSPQFWGSGCA